MLIRNRFFKHLLVGALSLFVLGNAYAKDAGEDLKFSRFELASVKQKPTVLVLIDTSNITHEIKLARGAKITSNGEVIKTQDLEEGDVLYIATRQVVSNIIVSEQNPIATELRLHKPGEKVFELEINSEKLEQTADQLFLVLGAAIFAIILLLITFAIKSSKKNSSPQNGKKDENRRRRI